LILLKKKLEKKKLISETTTTTTKNNKKEEEEEELDPSKYYENRSKSIKELELEGFETYPHKFEVNNSILDFIKTWSHLEAGTKETNIKEKIQISGRISLKRKLGNKLYFYTISCENQTLQILCDLNSYEEGSNKEEKEKNYQKINNILHRGDIIGTIGYPGKGKPSQLNPKGELSIYASKLILLSPCLHMLPKSFQEFKDQETRYRQRYLDLIINSNTRQNFITRSKIIRYIRNFLDNLGFIEVETPMMNLIPGGATAKPFVTYHNDLKKEFFYENCTRIIFKTISYWWFR